VTPDAIAPDEDLVSEDSSFPLYRKGATAASYGCGKSADWVVGVVVVVVVAPPNE